MRAIYRALARARAAGVLKPDSDPAPYFDSIRQWAVWTLEQRLDEAAYTRELITYTRRNVSAAGRQWTPTLENAVRALAPNRWRDIRRVIDIAKGRSLP